MTMLLLAAIAFVGTHFLFSHPLRAPLVRATGEGAFLGIYSLVALGTLSWMIIAYGRAPTSALLWPVGDALWAVSTLMMLVACSPSPGIRCFGRSRFGALRTSSSIQPPRLSSSPRESSHACSRRYGRSGSAIRAIYRSWPSWRDEPGWVGSAWLPFWAASFSGLPLHGRTYL